MASSASEARQKLFSVAPIAGHWFHSIEIAPGVWTNGHKSVEIMQDEMRAWQFPDDLTGKTVLDIGCADGGYSIIALRRGAKSVLSIDEQMTAGMALLLDSQIIEGLEFQKVSLFSNEFMTLPKYDFIIFAGVLYHVQDMLEALKRVRARTGGSCMIETHVNESLGALIPAAIYYEHDELGKDHTNWWGPNIPCLEALFRTAGFEFTANHVLWETRDRLNGRVGYTLRPATGGVFSDVIESATGSNSLLEEAREKIALLFAENQQLRLKLAQTTYA